MAGLTKWMRMGKNSWITQSYCYENDRIFCFYLMPFKSLLIPLDNRVGLCKRMKLMTKRIVLEKSACLD